MTTIKSALINNYNKTTLEITLLNLLQEKLKNLRSLSNPSYIAIIQMKKGNKMSNFRHLDSQ